MNTRAALAVVVTIGLFGSGCGFTAEDVARAGQRNTDTYTIKAEVSDALNLPDGAPVRVGGVSVGKVKDVEAKDYQAVVSLAIDNDIKLREGSTVRLRYTTALGEMFVQVDPAPQGAELKDGATLPRADAETAPSVEDALASASLLINGGGLSQIQTIVEEVNKTLEGRIGTVHSLMRKTDTFLRTALGTTREIDRILGALAATSTTLNRREATINAALKELRPAARMLTENTDDLARLLQATDGLGRTANRIVRASRADLTLVVRELGPVLDEVLGAKDQILTTLDRLAGAGKTLDAVVPNTYAMFYGRLRGLPPALAVAGAVPGVPKLPGATQQDPGPLNLGLPTLPGLSQLPLLGGLLSRTLTGGN
jgi:phospholipid/cholesterol/gamma-HCH transport system substrate-binding protein